MKYFLLSVSMFFCAYVIAQKPVIDSIRPRTAVPGSTITIYGTNFSGTTTQNAVYSNGIKWRVQSSTSTSIMAIVPAVAASGAIAVTNSSTGLIGVSKEIFRVIISGTDNTFKSGSFGKLKRIDSLPLRGEPELHDLDGDGKQDLVLNSSGILPSDPYNITILRNMSSGGDLKLGVRQNISLSQFNFEMNVADYDGDGKLDILSGGSVLPRLSIYRNLSTDTAIINFSGAQQLLVSRNTDAIMFSEDLNLDGKIDILRSDWSGDTLYIHRNTSIPLALSFSPEIKILTRRMLYRLIDFDNDGKKDIIGIESGIIYFQRNTSTTSNISFSTPTQYSFPTMTSGQDLLVNDFDGDGKTDFAVKSNSPGFVSIFMNTTNGSAIPQFATPQTYNCSSGYARFFSYDPDGDGLPDIGLETNNLYLSDIELLKNSSTPGTFNFSNGIILNKYDKVGVSRFGVGDINCDGKEDFIFGVNGGESFGFLENRSGKLTISSFNPRVANAGDTLEIVGSNFLGVDKVVFGNTNAQNYTIVSDTLIRAVLGLGSSGSVYVQKGNMIDSANSFKFGSLNNTKIDKLTLQPFKDQLILTNTVFGNDERRMYKLSIGDQVATDNYVSNGVISTTIPFCVGGEASTITLTYGGKTKILNRLLSPIFKGADTTFRLGMFDSLRVAAVIGNAGKLKLGSFVGDVANDCYILNNQNNGATFIQSFGRAWSGYSGSPFSSLNFPSLHNRKTDDILRIDLDQDGIQDYALLSVTEGKLRLYRNYSSIIIDNEQPIINLTVAANTKQVLKGDLNDDGKIDLVLTTTDNVAEVYLNRSTPVNIQFAPVQKITFSGSLSDKFQLFDVNGDNRADFIGSYGGQQITVITDTSSDKTLKYADMSVATASTAVTGTPLLADFDGDTMPDLAFRSESLKKLLVFTYSGTNALPFSYKQSSEIDVTVDQIKNIQFHDFDGNGYPDLVTESGKTTDTTSVISLFRNNTKPAQKLSFALPYEIRNIVGITDIKAADLNYDARPDLLIVRSRKSGTNTVNELLYMFNKITDTSLVGPKPVIRSATPMTISGKDTIRIIGTSFSRVGSVTFGGVPATYFTVTNDTEIRAVAGNGKSGFLTVRSLAGADSLGGITVTGIVNISSYTPKFALVGDSVRISGSNLDSTKMVSFGGVNAKSFRISGDSLVVAVVDTGATGTIRISGTKGSATADGFYFGPARILVQDSLTRPISNIVFTSESINKDSTKRIFIGGMGIRTNIRWTTPSKFQLNFDNTNTVSQNGYIMSPTNGSIIPLPYTIRYIGPLTGGDVTDSLILETPTGETKKIFFIFNVCDTSNRFIPRIADANIACFKDSIRVGVINSATRFAGYQWSNGDTTQTTLLRNSSAISLRVAFKPGCISDSSTRVSFLHHINPIPVLSLARDSVLSTQTAPQYKWYRNNRILNGVNGNVHIAKNIGLYKVETSANGVCWDGSNEIPIFTLPSRSNNDTLLLRAYPNPSSGEFTVQASLQNPTNVTARILITDMGGTTVIQNTRFIFFGREIRIPVTITNKGTYVVRVEMNGQVKTVNVIVQ